MFGKKILARIDIHHHILPKFNVKRLQSIISLNFINLATPINSQNFF